VAIPKPDAWNLNNKEDFAITENGTVQVGLINRRKISGIHLENREKA
jgi:hypothetical protein